MKSITLVFPNQLFKEIQFKSSNAVVYLIEEYLFFTQYDFHKQKIAFHRASMKYYESYLISKGIEVVYINAQDKLSDITFLIEYLGTLNITEVNIIDPVDNWLNRRINKAAAINNLFINSIRNPSFLNSESDLNTFFNKKNKKYFQTKFYIEQRKKRKILVDENLNPTGEKWSFDTENRKKYPKNSTPPKIKYPESDRFYKEAVEYVENNFKNNPGELNEKKLYPTNHDESELWFDEFLISRFKDFGHYEDAIVQNEGILNHSLLSPLINSGLLTPDLVISKSLAYSKQNNIPLNYLRLGDGS